MIQMRDDGYFWLCSETPIPKSMQGQPVYFDTNRATCAMDVYIDGQFIDSRGSLGPVYNMRPGISALLLIPAEAAADGKVTVVIRARSETSHAMLAQFFLGNTDRKYVADNAQAFFNNRVYLMMVAICTFLTLVLIRFLFMGRINAHLHVFFFRSVSVICCFSLCAFSRWITG